MGKRDFSGEVYTNIHPELLQAIAEANGLPVDGKTEKESDSRRAKALMQAQFRQPVEAVMCYNGTASNILALKAMLHSWSAVLCADMTHLNVYESGATEYMLGAKIVTTPSRDGKLTTEDVAALLAKCKHYHYLPELLVITQPTEHGALYSVEKLRTLCTYAHEKGLYVYIDGARIGYAVQALGTTLQEMVGDTGVDAFSFGGTKLGAMFGEMVVFLRKEHRAHLDYIQKQALQHMDKSKFIGVQMARLLEDDLWRKIAGEANRLAGKLGEMLEAKGIPLAYPMETNMVFAKITPKQLEKIRTVYELGWWIEEENIVRFCLTHESTDAMVEELAALL